MEHILDTPLNGRRDQVWGFQPIATPEARILVLGSMPGVASLKQAQYYAHPRNAFWPIAGRVLGFDPGLDYALRLEALQASGIALWDVLQACERPGSLDADIRPDTLVANDIAGFLQAYPGVVRICFNGAKAASLFRRHVLAALGGRKLEYVDLPSTSPAHAAASLETKLAAWERALKI
ncbi:DNA-deoxyinosine glycosylase [Achromobacter seleniivolatilans]|uniref:DNA-deoxyinosine glycosylase n=1 Tax=Achromobacter seleniivolatilans TaxID=3047478 RepID=A0ABY9M7Z1_9BURK|nr:DNA-deoxyinosine glycosylase [Achromobacter sp. R39]WMD22797.1 DNA-deoxyinosine glycosylase [Achromobacter sp. R39]